MTDYVGSRNSKPVSMINHRKIWHFILCAILCLIGMFFVIYGSIEYKSKRDYLSIVDRVGVVIDAGGSGTRMLVYKYANSTITQLKYIVCEKRGLTKYATNELNVLKKSLTDCFARGAVLLPRNKQVPIYFAATAGMRLLKLKNSLVYGKIWNLVRECVRNSQFKLAIADTISGSEEAKWAWVAANYLKDTLSTNKSETYGTIDFGSSSIQISFQHPNNTTTSDHEVVRDMKGSAISIYAHSYLCFGAVEMERRFLAKIVKTSKYSANVTNPCYFRGYKKIFHSDYLWDVPCSKGEYAKNVLGEDISGPDNTSYMITGGSNFTQCFNVLNNLIASTNCTAKDGLCGMHGQYQPKVHGKFFAMSTFWYINEFLALPPNSGKIDFYEASKKMCTRAWDDVSNNTASSRLEHVLRQCFRAAYGYYLLSNGFRFDNNSWHIEFVNKINNSNVGWSLGLIYTHRDEMFVRLQHLVKVVTRPGFISMIVIGPICLIIGFILSCIVCKENKLSAPV